MTGLLAPSARRGSAPASSNASGRPLALTAVLAGLAAAGTVLLGCLAVGLAAWFASDAGAHGDTRDAMRVGADAWLLAHGAPLQLQAATVAVMPLGLTAICGWVSFRLGRWAATTSADEDGAAVLLAVAAMAAMYGVVTTATALLASVDGAQPGLGRAFLGGMVLAALAGGSGLVVGSAQWPVWRERVPGFVRAVVVAALSVVLLVLAASSALVTLALVVDLGAAANVLSRLHTDVAGGLLFTLVVAAFSPNAALLGSAYLLGPGFTVGTGTLVSPSAVVLGPLPAFPLLAALPGEGPTPGWTAVLVAVPVLLAALAVGLVLHRRPVLPYEQGAAQGLVGGAVAGLLLGALTALAGGAVGPGRMADVGAPVGDTMLAAVVALGIGGLLGGVVATWSLRHRTTSA